MASTINEKKLKQLDQLTQDLRSLVNDAIESKKTGKQQNLQATSEKGVSLLLELKHLSGYPPFHYIIIILIIVCGHYI